MADKTGVETYPLQFPIELTEGVLVSEVKLRQRIKGADMRALSGAETEIDQGMAILSSLSGLEADVIDELDKVDFDALMIMIKKNRELQESKTPGH